ncbi:MAG: acyl-CoA dehydrogenase family protein [Steroidobacteraceae bacterium]
MDYSSPWVTADIALFREQFRRFLADRIAPEAERWRRQKIVDRAAWRAMGEMGALLPSVPEEFGGQGGTFAHEAAVIEELELGVPELTVGFSVHSPIAAHYILAYGSTEQKRRWLPRMATGELFGGIAMTEPGGGSDLQAMRTTARRNGGAYSLDGQKTFITNGQLADILVVAAKTDPSQGAKGISLFVLEAAGNAGFRRGRNLDKIGLHASDTSELFFDGAHVPAENLLGEQEGRGFAQLMNQLPQERLSIAVAAVAAIERALRMTVDYASTRQAFGRPIIEFQNTSFGLAELQTEAVIARIFVDWCIARRVAGELDTVTASMAKWWCTQKQFETVDRCLQLHGGYGYIQEFPIARMFADARIQKIYGGTNEIMKWVIARSLAG